MPRPSTARHRGPRALLAAAALTAVLGGGLAGCTGSSGSSGSEAAADRGVRAPEEARQSQGAGTGADRSQGGDADGAAAQKPPKTSPTHIIRTATLTVRVKDVPTALDGARTAAESAGGYVGDETTGRDRQGHERSRIVLRVPQDEYEEVLDDLAGAGKLIERKVDAKDVTDQVVDVESRIRSQRASVARVRELMDKATELSDVVTLEGELSTRQTELEALQAQQASLEERTAMATITLVLSETAVRQTEKKDDDETTFADALAGGWGAFVTALRWIAVALGAVLPFAAALAALLLLWRLTRRWLPTRLPRAAALSPAAGPTAGPAGPSARPAAGPVPGEAARPSGEDDGGGGRG